MAVQSPDDDDGADGDEVVAETLAEAPVMLSIEIASVALSMREWNALKRGETVVTGTHVGEPVTLRAGGRPVGLAELRVVGDLIAVRILEKTPS